MIRRIDGDIVWIARDGADPHALLGQVEAHDLHPEVLESEEAVGRAMLEELEAAVREKGEAVIALLGGRGAQAMHRLLGSHVRAGDPGELIRRLHVFTQDALAPMGARNGFSFVRDFERLLGIEFFEMVRSFTTLPTEAIDLEGEVAEYVEKLEAAGGLDIFFLGLGPEREEASHLAYIKPGSGATAADLAGIIPISQTILEHHITKFKAGGSLVSDEDEAECRRATRIITLGPAAILGAKRIVQSIVDADTAPAKRASFQRLMETAISPDPDERAGQLDSNPGLWIRLHPNVRSLVLPNVMP